MSVAIRPDLSIPIPMTSMNNEIIIDYSNTTTSQSLKVLSWNVNGDFKAKMLCPDFVHNLTQYDICILQETHLYSLDHESLNLPRNYNIMSLPRKYKSMFKKQYGGVAVLYREDLPVKLNKCLSSANVMVLDIL